MPDRVAVLWGVLKLGDSHSRGCQVVINFDKAPVHDPLRSC